MIWAPRLNFRKDTGKAVMRVVIVGAGPGGLTLALSLQAAGIDAEVYEAVPKLKPLGVGINVLAEERAPQGLKDVSEVFSREELEAVASNYKRVAGFDPHALNARASLTPPRRAIA